MPEIFKSDGYNEAQMRAICHLLGPAMITAGPGSGKTKVLTGRIRYLVRHGADPGHILVITFTKAAALSMRRRFDREMKGQTCPVSFGTFHAIFFSILKEHFSLSDECLLTGEEKRIFLKLHLTENEREQTEAIMQRMSRMKNGIPDDANPLPDGMAGERFSQLAGLYEQECRKRGKLDFDDMLTRCRELLAGDPRVLKKWQERFTYILVDEFQDCNAVQYEVLKLLAAPENNLFAVGDDDQSIYGFRGSCPGIMRRFLEDFPDAEHILLTCNYRSRKEILDAASRVIEKNKDRISKKITAAKIEDRYQDLAAVGLRAFPGHREQYIYIAARCRELSARIPFSEMAVLARTNRELKQLVPYLEAAGLPYRVKNGGEERFFYFSQEDVYSYIKLAAEGVTRSRLLRILERPRRGIGRCFLLEEQVCLGTVAERLRAEGKRKEAQAALTLERQLLLMRNMSPGLAVRMVRNGIGYEGWLMGEAGTDAAKRERWKGFLDSLQEQAECFDTLREWISYMESDSFAVKSEKGRRENADGIQLMTLHASKGLEFRYVCIPNLNEGGLPQSSALFPGAEEEERRLFYVGMTRAKTALDILWLAGTKENPKPPSRFLEGLL